MEGGLIAFFAFLGVVASLWIIGQQGISVLLDLKGVLSMTLVICVTSVVLGLVIVEGIKTLVQFLVGDPTVLALAILLLVLAFVLRYYLNRHSAEFDF